MNKERAIKQLKDLKSDRQSFLVNDNEHDELYLDDIKAIETVLDELNNSINKKIIKNRIIALEKTKKAITGLDKLKESYSIKILALKELLEDMNNG